MNIRAVKKVQLGDINISMEVYFEELTTEEDRLFASVQIMSLQSSSMTEEGHSGVTLQ